MWIRNSLAFIRTKVADKAVKRTTNEKLNALVFSQANKIEEIVFHSKSDKKKS